MKKHNIKIDNTQPADCDHLVVEVDSEKEITTFSELKDKKEKIKIWEIKLQKDIKNTGIKTAKSLRTKYKTNKLT